MAVHLPILQVVIPLLAAPLCLVLRHRVVVRAVTTLAAWAALGTAAWLLHTVLTGGPISYALGGWAPPWGIEYRVDVTTAYVLLVVSSIAAVVFPFGPDYAVRAAAGRAHLFYAVLLLCLSGLLGITITGDAFNIFVFLEISSLASYTLVGMGSDRRAPMAAFSYLILGTIGGTFVLLGVGFMYQMTGTLNLQDLVARLPDVVSTRTIILAFALLWVGISIKLAVFPLHQWLPNAYSYAPPLVAAFLAGTSTKVMYYLLIRIVFTVFGASFAFGALKLHYALVPLSVAAMFVGSIAAVFQNDVRRLLAYSSIAQIGYMTLALSYASETGLIAGLGHVFNHAVIKSGMFLAVGCLIQRLGTANIDALGGVGRRMPWTMGALVIGGLGLVGVPPTAGFISKWYLVAGALEKGWYLAALLVLASSLIALVYVWRLIEAAYFRQAPAASSLREAPIRLLIPLWALMCATLFLGVDTDLTIGVARVAARHLMGGEVP